MCHSPGSLTVLQRLKKSSVTVDAVRNYGNQHDSKSLRDYLTLSSIPFHRPMINLKHNQERNLTVSQDLRVNLLPNLLQLIRSIFYLFDLFLP